MQVQSSALIRYEGRLHTPAPTALHDRGGQGLQTDNHRVQTIHPFQHRLYLPPSHGLALKICSHNCAWVRRGASPCRLEGDMSPEIFDMYLYRRILIACTLQPAAVQHLHLSSVSHLYQLW